MYLSKLKQKKQVFKQQVFLLKIPLSLMVFLHINQVLLLVDSGYKMWITTLQTSTTGIIHWTSGFLFSHW